MTTKREMAVTIVQALFNRIGEPEERFALPMKKRLNKIMRTPINQVEYDYELARSIISSALFNIISK